RKTARRRQEDQGLPDGRYASPGRCRENRRGPVAPVSAGRRWRLSCALPARSRRGDGLMELFQPIAEKIAAHLIERGETIATGESSTGGLVAAAPLTIPSASAHFARGVGGYPSSSRMGF